MFLALLIIVTTVAFYAGYRLGGNSPARPSCIAEKSEIDKEYENFLNYDGSTQS